ncbi:MAG: 3-hydroxyacyl-CoA dehydrogenase family protein [Ferruginibacter sp.]
MRIAVLANDEQWEELNSMPHEVTYVRINSPQNIPPDAEACLFLQYDQLADLRVTLLPVLIDAVSCTLMEINAPANMVRINGWKSFLSRDTWEVSGECSESFNQIFKALGKRVVYVPDEPGFISARVIAMIINEAYFALEEKISTREEIDIAMKLGTNYPYGPFEWGALIGENKVVTLLQKLSRKDQKYLPARLLQQVAIA